MHHQHSGDHLMSFLNGTDPGLRQTRTPTTDNFAAGVDFTAGSTTQLTLSADPGTEDNVEITFDGIQQHRNTYSVSGAVVTFDAAIGAGVSNVEATFTTTIPAATPADGSVTTAKLADFSVTSAKIAASVSLGKVLQVQQTILTAATWTTTSATPAIVTGLAVNITPASTSNKILVMATVHFDTISTTQFAAFDLARDSTLLTQGAAAGSRRQIHAGGASYSNQSQTQRTLVELDSPASVSSITYSVYGSQYGTGTVYINRSTTDSDNSSFSRNVSTITAMEIAG
jgi:hypothetical protein